jgi:glycerol-3-phosphate O-acyltransferase / dihydroxyacetone phosphate acyltransferase
MLYALLKPIIQISLRAYFKRIEVIGAENLEHGATLFVCNHPSALFDPIMVASNTKRPIHFLAGAEWFGSGIQKWFFQNQFKMIPVFRPWLAEGKEKAKENNDEMFSACYASLSRGNRIIIFPEASSVTVPWIRSIKTGAARIKLGADAASGQDIKIVPIGLNYTNSHRFQTSVIVNVGDPIDFIEIQNQKFEDEKERVRAMTDLIYERMSELVYYPEDSQHFDFIKDLKKLMVGVLDKELGIADGNAAKQFKIRKKIVNEIEEIGVQNPQELKSISERLRAYIVEYQALGFRKYNPFEERTVNIIAKVFALIVGAPLFILGAIYNGFPFLFTQRIYLKYFLPRVTKMDAEGQLNSAFAGSLGFSVGLAIYLLWYIILWVLASLLMPAWISFLMTIALGYVSGRFAMIYYKWLIQAKKYFTWNMMAKRDVTAIESLLKEREQIIQSLLELRSKSK